MAGDWIKMRAGLLTHPKVIGMVKHLQDSGAFFNFVCHDEVTGGALAGFEPDPKCVTDFVTRNALRYITVSGLLALWSAARLHSNSGCLCGLLIEDLDEMAGIPSFGFALESVGWAKYDKKLKGVVLPNFLEWNDQTHKDSPKSNAERQKAFRERKKTTVTNSNESNDRVEESRVEESIKTGCAGGAGVFSKLTEADLADTARMVAWHKRASSRKQPVVGASEADLLFVLTAAEKALDVGDNPPAMFAAIVSKGLRGNAKQEHEDLAVERLKAHRSAGPPANLASQQLAKQLKTGD